MDGNSSKETSKAEQEMEANGSKHTSTEEQEAFKRRWAGTKRMVWTKEVERKLRESVKKRRCDRHGPTINQNILVFGPKNSGKSTLCDGFISAVEDLSSLSSYFSVSSMEGTFTKGFLLHRLSDCLCLIDVVGITNIEEMEETDLQAIAKCKGSFRSKLSEILKVQDAIQTDNIGHVECVVIVLRLGMEITTNTKLMIRCIIDLAGKGVLVYRVVLTFPDICESKFKDPAKLPEIFDSPAIQNAVLSVAEETGIPPAYLNVVRNYTDEKTTDLHSNILLLHPLDQVVNAAFEMITKRDKKDMMKEIPGNKKELKRKKKSKKSH